MRDPNLESWQASLWDPHPARPEVIARTLMEHGVKFVFVGATAAALRDLGPPPRAVELCYCQEWTNCECLANALEQLEAQVVPDPPVPIPLPLELRQGREPLELHCPAGAVRLLPGVPGLGPFEELFFQATLVEHDGSEVLALTAEQLTRAFQHSRRPTVDAVRSLLALWHPDDWGERTS